MIADADAEAQRVLGWNLWGLRQDQWWVPSSFRVDEQPTIYLPTYLIYGLGSKTTAPLVS